MQPKSIQLNKNISAAVTFVSEWLEIDPRNKLGPIASQRVIVCILRPLCRGPRETFCGVAVCNPREVSNTRTGQAIALARAIQQVTGEDFRAAHSMARRWFWEQDQAEQVAQLNAQGAV